MEDGLYESLVTRRLERRLDQSGATSYIEDVDTSDQPHVLARHVAAETERALSAIRDPERRVQLINNLLDFMDSALAAEQIAGRPRQLLAVRTGPSAAMPLRPATPLSEAALLTNSREEPNLGPELRAELGSADGVDLLCAFVKWHGLRVLEEPLIELRRRRARMRVITTTYIGATERRALDRLARQFGAEVKIQYDALRTRLHAKAWLFHRSTGFDTAYVGSSNLSRSALLEGVEWNVRLSRVGTPDCSRSSAPLSRPTGMIPPLSSMTPNAMPIAWMTRLPKPPGAANTRA